MAPDEGAKRFSLRSRLFGSLAFLALWMVAIGLANVYSTRAIHARLEGTAQRDVTAANLLVDVGARVRLVHTEALLHLNAESSATMDEHESEIEQAGAETKLLLNALADTYQSQTELDALAGFRFAWNAYWRTLEEELLPTSAANRKKEALSLVEESGAAGVAASTAFDQFAQLQKTSIAAARDRLQSANQQRSRSQTILVSLILLSAALALAFAGSLGVRVVNAVDVISSAARLVAEGDLDWSVTLETGDEIESMAESFTKMTRHVRRTLATTRETGEQLQRQVSERKRVEAMLAVEKDRFLTTLGLIGEGVILVDTAGDTVFINQAAAKLTGWSEEQAVGRPLHEVLHVIDQTTGLRCENPVRQVLQTGKTTHSAGRRLLVASYGAQRPIAHSSAPLRDQHNEIVGVVVVLREVTEHVTGKE